VASIITQKAVRNEQGRVVEPAVGKCDCGREIVIESVLTNECCCGALYNWNGDRLLPRSQWEEEY
jgi:hypothetical protein